MSRIELSQLSSLFLAEGKLFSYSISIAGVSNVDIGIRNSP